MLNLYKSKYGYNTWSWKRPFNGFKHLLQRLIRGYDDSEIWNLDSTIALFILPRLKLFRNSLHGYPNNLTFEQWEEVLDKMIIAFSLIDDVAWHFNDFDYPRVEEGLDLFRKYYFNLWD